MPDSVRCTESSSNQFTCEVQLDSDFDTPELKTPRPASSTTVPPPPAPPPDSRAVATLVSTFTSKTLVHLPPPPIISAAALAKCASSELGIVLAAVTSSKSPILAVLSMAKAALDAGQCLTDVHNAAAQRNAENYCHDIGGVVTSNTDEKLVCEVDERPK